MAPVVPLEIDQEQPLSRTYQYRKVMKPMLERKRRARINKCLDELKDLMVSALSHEGENVTKLEKADVLELTVRHLRQLKQNRLLGVLNPRVLHDRYMAGFAHCASQVGAFVGGESGGAANGGGDQLDASTCTALLGHMSKYMQTLDRMAGFHNQQPQQTSLTVTPSSSSPSTQMGMVGGGVMDRSRVITPPLTPPSHHHGAMEPISVQCGPVDCHPSFACLPPQLPSCQLSPSSCCSEASSSVCVDETSCSEVEDDKVWRPW